MKQLISILLSLLLFCACEKKTSPDEAELINSYGALRADMVRTACKIVGCDNDSILQLINNKNLNTFKQSIAVTDTLLYSVISTARPLKGTIIEEYQKNLRDTRRYFQYRLATLFPNREDEIENAFHGYIKSIDSLTNKLSIEKETKPESMPPIHTVEASKDSNMRLWIYIILSITATLIILVAVWNRKRIAKIFRKKPKKDRTATSLNNPEDNEDTAQEAESSQYTHTSEKSEAQPEKINMEPTDIPNDEQKISNIAYSQTVDSNGKMTATDDGKWIVVGASVQGNSHVDSKQPCQDNHIYESLGGGWGIAITSDGAGSAKLSQIGSAAAVSRALFHFKELIAQKKWAENGSLPSDNEWMKLSFKVLKTVRDELEALAKKNKHDLKELNATIIVVIHSPVGLMSAHIGDGRAGYRDFQGNWHSLITPHKGEEANQTIFIPSNFWDIPFYEMSGVTVPESRVVREQVSAFTLMSDGCEATAWLWNQKNESTCKFFDPNLPHDKFFNPLLETLQEFRKEETPLEERAEKWFKFIQSGNKSFIRETDDKTMILGAFYM